MHPDKYPGNAKATPEFLLLKTALDVLKDPAKRAAYAASKRRGRRA